MQIGLCCRRKDSLFLGPVMLDDPDPGEFSCGGQMLFLSFTAKVRLAAQSMKGYIYDKRKQNKSSLSFGPRGSWNRDREEEREVKGFNVGPN